MRNSLLGMASCALALSLAVNSADAGTNEAKFRATRDIAVDSVTGKPRKPTAIEVANLVADLRKMTSRRAVAATSDMAPALGGSTVALEGFDGVVLARPRPDGSYETRCVFSFEEGVEFLGLVAEETE